LRTLPPPSSKSLLCREDLGGWCVHDLGKSSLEGRPRRVGQKEAPNYSFSNLKSFQPVRKRIEFFLFHFGGRVCVTLLLSPQKSSLERRSLTSHPPKVFSIGKTFRPSVRSLLEQVFPIEKTWEGGIKSARTTFTCFEQILFQFESE